VDLYLRARRFAKLRTTYVQQLRDHAIGDRVHCTFNQVKRAKDDADGDDEGTISGRLSATDPSLQNQPIRDPVIGELWRRAYLADEGAEWACLDFSSQEPRWLVHVAALSGCTGAAAVRDAYRENPALDLYVTLRDRIGWQGDEGRSKTKTIYLGLAYSMGGAKLCRQLGVPTRWTPTKSNKMIEVAGDEGQRVLDDFHRGAPFIRELNQRTERAAREKGFVRTALGRVCRFPRAQFGAPGYDWTHKATNRIVQGSSADQTKMAMVLAHEAGIPLQLQVHDELDLSVADRETAKQLAETMLNAVPCTVPHRVVPEFGRSWGELE
jgi:DNA polymerase I-like protein with 3'-5' exonuclease and polymerase domains